MKKLVSVILAVLCVATLTACSSKNNETSGKLKVSVTFNAIKEFVSAVGKDKVEISTIIPDGTEPHDFEPKPKDMVGLAKADVVVYNGMDMEKWVSNAVTASGNQSIVKVEASSGITPIKNTEEAQKDPHAWLSIKGAETEVKNIADALIKKDPANSDYYKKNCDEFTNQLESLFKKYQDKFKAAKRKDFVTGHAAFAYFCRDFGLEQNSVEDVFAEGEPSAKQMNQLIAYCKEKNVKTIFAEEMVSPEVSKTLAASVGADVKTIYTFESNEDNKTYLERMESNLKKIDESLN
jgi:zinc transport system substrate-binding protein